MNSKICADCGVEKPLEAFPKYSRGSYRTSSGSDAYHSYCKECRNRRAREWRATNKGYRGSGKFSKYPIEDKHLISAISNGLSNAKGRIKLNRAGCPDMYDLDIDYMYQLFKKQNGLCALSGIELSLTKGESHVLSIDRIEPNKGYTKGNVQWVSWAVNRAKGDLTYEQFTDMCEAVYLKVQRLVNPNLD